MIFGLSRDPEDRVDRLDRLPELPAAWGEHQDIVHVPDVERAESLHPLIHPPQEDRARERAPGTAERDTTLVVPEAAAVFRGAPQILAQQASLIDEAMLPS